MNIKHFIKNYYHTSVAIILLSLAATLSITGCSNIADAEKAAASPQSTNQAAISPTLLVYGTVKMDDIKELQISFPARITDVTAKKGALVNHGDPLMTLNLDDYKLQIAKLEKELEGYQLEIKELQSNTNADAANIDAISKELALKKSYVSSGQDPDILPLKNTLSALNNDLLQAKQRLETNQLLFAAGSISQDEVHQSQLAIDKLNRQIQDTTTSIKKITDTRQVEISTLQSKLKATTLQVGNADVTKSLSIDQLQVKVESTLLSLQNMKSKLNEPFLKDNQIIAPKDNLIIYEIAMNSGSSVSGLGQSLIKFIDTDELYAIIDIPEESLSRITLNTPVTLKVADQNVSSPITGNIVRLSNYAVNKDGDTIIEAYVNVTSGKEFLKPGLSVDAYIEPQS